MLGIRGLHKIYGKYHALNGLDMTVEADALYGFTGPNGAGKTTIIEIMAGLLEAEEGRITINGMDARVDLGKLKSMIGYVSDFFGVYGNLTVSEYMEFFAAYHHISGLVVGKRYTAPLEQAELENKLDLFVDGLSRDMKQRLYPARALTHDPSVLILDELTSGLGPRIRLEFRKILKKFQGSGRIIVISSHVLSELSKLCTDIGVIDQGRMVLEGNTDNTPFRVSTSDLLVIPVFTNIDKALSTLEGHPCMQTISLCEQDICAWFAKDVQDEAPPLQQLIDNGVLVNGSTREKGSPESVFI